MGQFSSIRFLSPSGFLLASYVLLFMFHPHLPLLLFFSGILHSVGFHLWTAVIEVKGVL